MRRGVVAANPGRRHQAGIAGVTSRDRKRGRVGGVLCGEVALSRGPECVESINSSESGNVSILVLQISSHEFSGGVEATHPP